MHYNTLLSFEGFSIFSLLKLRGELGWNFGMAAKQERTEVLDGGTKARA